MKKNTAAAWCVIVGDGKKPASRPPISNPNVDPAPNSGALIATTNAGVDEPT